MPEYPDVTVYIEALRARREGHALEGIRLASPFLLRTAEPPIVDTFGRRVVGFERIGKRIVFCMEGDLFLVLHLMIAGRLHWKDPGAAILRSRWLCAFDHRRQYESQPRQDEHRWRAALSRALHGDGYPGACGHQGAPGVVARSGNNTGANHRGRFI